MILGKGYHVLSVILSLFVKGNSAVEPQGCGVLRPVAVGYLGGAGVSSLAQSQSHTPVHDPRTRGEAQPRPH